MAEKILNTRIQLKYDSLQNWATANTLLKQGEVAVAYLPPKGNGVAPAATSDAVLMKVGPGNFNDLPFVSALAADVYGWAKENKLTIIKDGTGNVVSSIEWDATANDGKGGIKFTTAAVATSEGLANLQEDVDAIEKDIADNRDAWAKDDNTTYTFALSTDGKGITITPSEGEGTTVSFAFLTQAEIEALNYATKGELGAVDAKFADYTTTAKLDEQVAELGYAKTTAIPTKVSDLTNDVPYLVAADVAGKADKTYVDTELGKKQDIIPAETYDTYGAAASAESAAKGYTDQKLLDFENAYIKADDNGTIDKLNEIAAWIADDQAGAAKVIADVATNAANIQAVGGDLDKVELQLNGIAAGDGTVKTAIETAESNAKGYADSLAGNYATAAQGTKADSAVQPGDLATVATSGAYTDLTGTPTLGALAAKDKIAEADIDGTIGVAKVSGLGALATKDNITHELVTDFDAEVAKIKVTNATNADKATADAAGNNIADTYATKEEVGALTTDDINGGEIIWILVCGSATEVI